MSNNKITFRIDRKGEIHLEVSDEVVGTECEALTRKFEEALGIKVESNLKPAYWNVLDDLKIEVNE